MKYQDKRKLVIRIVAIAMAVTLLLSILTLLLNSAFAAGLDADGLVAIAQTGSQDTPKWPIFAAVGAVAVIAACVILPKLHKKD